jgi:uncharacterized membrane protein
MVDPRRRCLVAIAVALPLFVLGCTFAVGGLAKNEWHGDVPHYESFGTRVLGGEVPYHNFYLEYPPGALPVFVVPAAVSKTHYITTFKLLMTALGCIALIAAAVALTLLGAGARRLAFGLGAIVVAPPLLGHVYLNRYDPWPAALAALALLFLLLPRVRTAGALLALGFTAKIFAAAALPVVAIRVWRTRGPRELGRGAAAFVAICAAVVLPFAIVALGGLGFSFYTQSTRPLQSESLGASILLVADRLGLYRVHLFGGKASSVDIHGTVAAGVGVLSSIVVIAAVAAVAWLYLRGDDRDERSVAAFAAAIAGYVVFFKVLSPQYLTWLVPLVPLVRGRRGRAATLLFLVAVLLTQIELYGWIPVHGVPGTSQLVGEPHAWLPWILLSRNLLLVAVFGLLLAELRATAFSSAQSLAAPVRGERAVGPGSCSGPRDARSPSSSAAAPRG